MILQLDQCDNISNEKIRSHYDNAIKIQDHIDGK